MRTIVFIFFILGFIIMGYWSGNTSLMSLYLDMQGGANSTLTLTDSNSSINFASQTTPKVKTSILDSAMVGIGLLGTVGLIASLLGFGSFFIFPAVIFFVLIANFCFLPLSFLVDSSVPPIISLPLTALINVMIVSTVYTAIRGG